jgi:hypothetical protein
MKRIRVHVEEIGGIVVEKTTRWWFPLLFALVFVLYFSIILGYAGDSKTLRFGEQTITVPEQAPDFTSKLFDIVPVGTQKYPLGHISLFGGENESKSTMVMVLVVTKGEVNSIVAFAVVYKTTPKGSWECYEDTLFATTGVVSGVFDVFKGGVSMERYSRWLRII